MATTAENFATSTSVACTLAALANGSARESSNIDNSSTLYDDAMFTLKVQLAAGTPASDKCVYVYFAGTEDAVLYTEPATGSDAAITISTPTNLTLGMVINCVSNATNTFTKTLGSVAMIFGGVLPRKWNFIVENKSGLAFYGTEANFQKTYTGVRSSAA